MDSVLGCDFLSKPVSTGVSSQKEIEDFNFLGYRSKIFVLSFFQKFNLNFTDNNYGCGIC
jgi:hypothetical protein